MKRRPFARLIRTLLFWTILGIGFLTGCGSEKEVDYSIEEINGEEENQKEKGKSGLAQFDGEENWNDTLEIYVDSEKEDAVPYMASLRIDAEIKLPDCSQMSVMEVVEPEFDADYKKTLANRIFDEVYYGDAGHLPRKDLERIRDSLYGTVYSQYPTDWEEEEKERYALLDALDHLESAGDAYTPAEEYTLNDYIGVMDGRTYRLSFTEVPGDATFIRHLKVVSMTPNDVFEVCPEKFREQNNLVYAPWLFGEWAQNHCSVAKEDAEREAGLFVKKLGLDYPVPSAVYPLAWGAVPDVIPLEGLEETSDWEVNGYVFSFDLGIDGISFVEYGMEEDYVDFWGKSDRSEEVQYSLQARLQIYVTDQGIIRAEIQNPVQIKGLSEGVGLLPLETVKDIMKDEVERNSEVFRLNLFMTNSFNEMELIYFRIRDKEHPGHYSYVPAWRLAEVMEDTQNRLINIRNPILINAIDGSVINFYDET